MSINNSNPLNGTGTERRKPTDASLTLDKILHLLSNSRRRAALEYLVAADAPVEFAELVDAVAEAEYERPVEDISSADRHAVYTSLYQSHLPKLNQEEIVDYERTSGTIRRGQNLSTIEQYLLRLYTRPSLRDRLVSSLADAVAHL